MKQCHWGIFITCFFIHSLVYGQADMVIFAADIFTANPEEEFAEAMAITNNTIVFVGSAEDAEAWIGDNTKTYDFGDQYILPGIHDIHNHLLEASFPGGFTALDPWEVDPENLGTTLANAIEFPNSNGWIMGFGHSIFTLLEATRPTKEILDEIWPDTPVCILEETSHSVWVNSKALEIMEIDENTPDPIGGHIYKFPGTSVVDGILFDNAGDAVLQVALQTNAEIEQLYYSGLSGYGLGLAAKNGITSMCEGRTYYKRNYQEIWKKIRADDKLTARVMLAPWLYPEDSEEDLITAFDNLHSTDDPFLRTQQIKCYSDGILINATAALHEPYDDNLGLPFNTGLNYVEVNRLTSMITAMEVKGYDFHIHAIGDRGITEALDAIEAARATNGDVGARHRITHLEVVDPEDYERFYELDVIADFQVAAEWTNPSSWNENAILIGKERSMNFIPVRSIYNTGATVCLSSDFDVSTLNPFQGIENAYLRAPQHLNSVEEIMYTYTLNGAYAMRQEDKVGSLETGKLADFIVVDQDIFSIDPESISETEVIQTWVDGKIIYDKNGLVHLTEVAVEDYLSIGPIPTNDYVQIQLKNQELGSLEIYNGAGLLMYTSNPMGQSKINVKVLDWESGIYFVKAFINKEEYVLQKLVVTK